MTIKNDLENALALLEYDIEQHVAALAAARAAILDTEFIVAATAKIVAFTQTLAKSNAPQDYAEVVPPPLPSFLVPTPPSETTSITASIAAALANTPQ